MKYRPKLWLWLIPLYIVVIELPWIFEDIFGPYQNKIDEGASLLLYQLIVWTITLFIGFSSLRYFKHFRKSILKDYRIFLFESYLITLCAAWIFMHSGEIAHTAKLDEYFPLWMPLTLGVSWFIFIGLFCARNAKWKSFTSLKGKNAMLIGDDADMKKVATVLAKHGCNMMLVGKHYNDCQTLAQKLKLKYGIRCQSFIINELSKRNLGSASKFITFQMGVCRMVICVTNSGHVHNQMQGLGKILSKGLQGKVYSFGWYPKQPVPEVKDGFAFIMRLILPHKRFFPLQHGEIT